MIPLLRAARRSGPGLLALAIAAGAASAHRSVGLAAVTGERDEGGHWLGTFATYLVTRRGLP